MSGDRVTAGERVGRPGAGGRECPGRAPLQGTGETEAQSSGRGWALQPQLAQLGVVLAVSLSSASRTLSLCACRSLPLSAGCPLFLCVSSQAVCPCPSASGGIVEPWTLLPPKSERFPETLRLGWGGLER